MASCNSCIIHFDGKKAHLQLLVKCLFKNFWIVVAFNWLTLDGEHRDVSRRSLAFVGENVKNVTTDLFSYANFSYHRACYSALTNNSNIKRAQVRCQHKIWRSVPVKII